MESDLLDNSDYDYDDPTRYLRRILNNGQEKFDSSGQAVGAVIGIIYVFAFIYYLSVKFFNHIIEDIVYLVNYKEDEDKELYRPIVYCILNSIPVLAFTLSSILQTDYDSGIMLTFSTDMINICLIYGLLLILVILPVKKEGSDVDGWLLLRDSLWYSIGVGLFAMFLFLDIVTWWAGLVMICYYLTHLIIQSQNETIRNEIYLLIGLKHEDDSFNADEQTRQRKRRISVTELSYKNYIDKQEELLQKKIMRMDALLRVKFKDQLKKKEVFSKWQVAVYTVMFGIRNKHKDEKNLRSINYAKLFANKNCDVPSDNNSNPEIDQKQLPNEEEELIDKQASDPDIPKKPISERKIRPEDDGKSENIDGYSNKFGDNNRFQQQMNENQSDKDVKANSLMNEDPNMVDGYNDGGYNMQDKFQVTLSLPEGAFDKICHIIFFPIHFIIFLLPNYHINPSHRKLAASFFVNLVIISGLMVLLQYLMDNLAGQIGGHNSIYSITITGIFLQLPFFIYNYQFAKKEKDPVDFLLTFIQLGIFKMGIVVGFSVLISSIVALSEKSDIIFHSYFKVVLLIIIGIVLINFFANLSASKYLLFCYVLFFVSAIILLAL